MPKQQDAAELDFAVYASKVPSDLQRRFAEWIPEVTEFDPSNCKTKQDAFEEGVRLATALRMHFQRSPENQELLEQRRAGSEAQAEVKSAKKAAKASVGTEEAPKAARGRKPAVKAAPVVEEDEAVSEPTPRARRAARRPAAKAAATTAEAPF